MSSEQPRRDAPCVPPPQHVTGATLDERGDVGRGLRPARAPGEVRAGGSCGLWRCGACSRRPRVLSTLGVGLPPLSEGVRWPRLSLARASWEERRSEAGGEGGELTGRGSAYETR